MSSLVEINQQQAARITEIQAASLKSAQVIDSLAHQNAQMREALEIIAGKRHCLDDLMSNVSIANAALALPNLSDEILRKRDAEILRKLVQSVITKTNTGYIHIGDIKRMADELEQSK